MTHRLSMEPPKSYVPTVPKIIRKNEKRRKTSNIAGSEFKMACTSFFILGIELMVLSGLNTRITLIADILLDVISMLTQPIMTTVKSSCVNRYLVK